MVLDSLDADAHLCGYAGIGQALIAAELEDLAGLGAHGLECRGDYLLHVRGVQSVRIALLEGLDAELHLREILCSHSAHELLTVVLLSQKMKRLVAYDRKEIRKRLLYRLAAIGRLVPEHRQGLGRKRARLHEVAGVGLGKKDTTVVVAPVVLIETDYVFRL